ncbi:MAG: hypothetical protein UY08_C0015G0005 [Candidatus Gottesmanbacteria bacterium GW2011_GWA1_47_8]|uniref:Uncharacterized protein n=1 Tax=Candidatus Gottesmanbacteria bacterium GW2011_GWA1_47_8 TaxID=1618438 RepID=A0A0G1VR30_9BACT|nr:MAG: hypothetical protein UY08_C0015G0005 [Candidatus Gottesmanbacteria bacterium GW2011_GWA1_47_8]
MEPGRRQWGLFSSGLVLGAVIGLSMGTDEGKRFSRRLTLALEDFWRQWQTHSHQTLDRFPPPPKELPISSAV